MPWHMESRHERMEIRRSFERAHSTYDRWADVQCVAAEELLSLLPERYFETVLEIGCGTGLLTSLMMERVSCGTLVVSDIVPEMVEQAKARLGCHKNIMFLAADASSLPLILNAECDLVISGSSLHWLMHDTLPVLDALHGMLSDTGWLVVSLFTDSSLAEFREALNLFADRHVKLPLDAFPSAEELEKFSVALQERRFKRLKIKRAYRSVLELMRVLHRTGVAPHAKGEPLLLSGRQGLRRLEDIFMDKFGSVSVTYDLFLFAGRRKLPVCHGGL